MSFFVGVGFTIFIDNCCECVVFRGWVYIFTETSGAWVFCCLVWKGCFWVNVDITLCVLLLTHRLKLSETLDSVKSHLRM